MIEKELEKLEKEFIDKYSVSEVLSTIVKICDLKADFIQENWGPPLNYGQLPKAWHKKGTQIASIISEIQKQEQITR